MSVLAAIPAPPPVSSWRSPLAADPGRAASAAHAASNSPPSPPAPLCDFNPDPAETQRILALLVQPSTSLVTLAQHLHLGIGALALWLARADVQAQLTAINAAAGTVTRAAAINQLPCVPIALGEMIRGHTADQSVIFKPCFATAKLKELQRANARKAAALLLRLARFDPSRPLAPLPGPRRPDRRRRTLFRSFGSFRPPSRTERTTQQPQIPPAPVPATLRTSEPAQSLAPARSPTPAQVLLAPVATASAPATDLAPAESTNHSPRPAAAAQAEPRKPTPTHSAASRAWRKTIAADLIRLLQPDEHARVVSRMEHTTDQDLGNLLKHARGQPRGPAP